MKEHIETLISGKPLSAAALEEVFSKMFRGQFSESEIAAYLVLQHQVGETAQELYAGANAMRKAASPVKLPPSVRPLTDNCGTGGDSSNSFNISTASAIVAASCGLAVAKHGNRSVSSKCGSADLLFEAGFPDNLTPEQSGKLLAECGFTFFFAPHFHPVMKHVMPVRKSLRVRTIFNLLGPLANPISPEFQIVGVGSKDYLKPMGLALQKLGVTRALVVHSRDGLDEISPAATTDGFLVEPTSAKAISIDPDEVGMTGKLDDLKGGDATFNKAILDQLLAGKAPGVANCVALNAGAALWISDHATSHKAGAERALAAIQDGSAKSYFEKVIASAKGLQ